MKLKRPLATGLSARAQWLEIEGCQATHHAIDLKRCSTWRKRSLAATRDMAPRASEADPLRPFMIEPDALGRMHVIGEPCLNAENDDEARFTARSRSPS